MPEAHAVHAATEEEPSFSLYLPRAQSSQESVVRAVSPLYFPLIQSMHASLLYSLDLNVPDAQPVQGPEEGDPV